MAETPGQRLYMIRLACGDGVREAETLKKFSARVKRVTKRVYHPNTLSLLERMEQTWRLPDFETLAQVDPLQRGAPWIAFGILPEARPEEELTGDEAEGKATRRGRGA